MLFNLTRARLWFLFASIKRISLTTIIGLLRTITKHKELSEALRKRTFDLHKYERFLYNISKELQVPNSSFQTMLLFQVIKGTQKQDTGSDFRRFNE